MRTIDFFPCKVCKSPDTKNEEDLIVPVPELDSETGEIKNISCENQKNLSNDQKKQLGLDVKEVLKNCEITVLEGNKVICYKCHDGFFYDGASQKCRHTAEYSTMKGCSLTYDNVHCMFCQNGMQLDITSGKCISKTHKIDFSKLDSGMGPQYNLENQAYNQREEQMQSQMYSSNSFSDEAENNYLA
jgi:hypothetical protein